MGSDTEWHRIYRKKVDAGMSKRLARKFASIHLRIKRLFAKLNADERYWR